jgi:hypothetical protein
MVYYLSFLFTFNQAVSQMYYILNFKKMEKQT